MSFDEFQSAIFAIIAIPSNPDCEAFFELLGNNMYAVRFAGGLPVVAFPTAELAIEAAKKWASEHFTRA